MPTPEQLADDARTKWTPLLKQSALKGDSRNEFATDPSAPMTHLRFSIFPDGGVARLRVFGIPTFDRSRVRAGSEVDVAAMENGGLVVSCSDMFFGHRHNLILPGRSTHMGDGWETKRRRGPGHDWIVVRLAARAALHRIEIDTDHFKGNAPGSCVLETCDRPDLATKLDTPDKGWTTLLEQAPLQPHARHRWEGAALTSPAPATHARLSIHPDGGIARLRLFGTLV
jgi:allantoicase